MAPLENREPNRTAGGSSCRFIGSRRALDIDRAGLALQQPLDCEGPSSSPIIKEYQHALACRLFEGAGVSGGILCMHKSPIAEASASKAGATQPGAEEPSLREAFQSNKRARLSPGPPRRHVNSAPTRILDAPGLHDNFYLNLLDWGASSLLAVGLGREVVSHYKSSLR